MNARPSSKTPRSGGTDGPRNGPGPDHQRLEHLYAISKLFASFENAEQPIDTALGIVTKTMPLRSAILIETDDDDRATLIVWPCEGQSFQEMQVSREHAQAAYSSLVGFAATEALNFSEQVGRTQLPRPATVDGALDRRFIVIPLVVAHHRPFGVLQLEGAQPLDESDLTFASAIVNQLATALDRERAWRRDITRREWAEERKLHAETSVARSERARAIAESSSEKYAALARENSKLYEQAQQAVQAREQILAMVSHDLRNPLGTILMSASLLSHEAPEERRHVASIERAAKSMLRLVEDLLDFASIEAGRLSIQPQSHDPGSLIEETLASFEGVAQAKGLRLTAQVGQELPKVFCDRGRILQVLSNLVSNSTKVTAESGQISLRVQARGEESEFAVSDTGPGISEEDAKHLFQRYWRSREVRYAGSGLGLAIARGIVTAHGGQIWMETEVGRGTTFHFTLPASAGRATVIAALRTPGGQAGT
ncbi:MAG: HAMP domain-containing sensor histidine kinase [Deltaproteobacteria bacterium]